MPQTESKVPRTVWVLGFVSLLMDISSEMIHAVLPLFMVGTLGAGAVWIGLVEGVGEGAALVTKVFSGALADRIGRRKGLVFTGYALGVLCKPLFAVAGSMPVVLGARLLDRIGKGMRGAPRDALIAEVTPEPVMGAAYGLRQSLDAAGAFVGPALATVLLLFFALDYRTLFWAALIPGACCLLLIVLGVREPEIHLSGRRPVPLPWRELLTIRSRAFHGVVIVGILFSLARFSNAFIVLRAADVGITPSLIPLVMVAMNAVFSLASYPFGRLADKVSAEMLLGVGLLLLIVSDAVFAWVPTPAGVLSGVALWGLHLGATQGLFAVLIARSAPQDRKATAFGVFNFFSGLAMLASGLIAGVLWQFAGAQASFAGGAVFAAACLLSIRFVRL